MSDEREVLAVKPHELAAKKPGISPMVIRAFNELIAKKWDGSRAVLNQKEVAEHVAKAVGVSVMDVFNNGLLNIEEVFQQAGWDITYSKDVNTHIDPTFTFRVRKVPVQPSGGFER